MSAKDLVVAGKIPLSEFWLWAEGITTFAQTGRFVAPPPQQTRPYSPEDDCNNYDASNVPEPDPSIVEGGEDSHIPF